MYIGVCVRVCVCVCVCMNKKRNFRLEKMVF